MQHSTKTKYLIVDTETGGLEWPSSLLTAYFQIVDPELNILSDFEMAIKPSDGMYNVTAGALKVNRIDLVEHDKMARYAVDVSGHLSGWLHTHSNGGTNKLVPVGQFVNFDIGFIKEQLNLAKEWNFVCTRGYICTKGTAEFLKLANKLPHDLKTGLSDLCAHFGIKLDKAHVAKNDVEATRKVLAEYLMLL